MSRSRPDLFVFYNPDAYGPRAGWVSNQEHQGFIIESSDWIFDGALKPPYSTQGAGNQVVLPMRWQLEGDKWSLYLLDERVGYFLTSNYAGGPLGQGQGEVVQFGGEVAPADAQSGTGPMGSGVRPSSSGSSDFGRVAFQRLLKVQTSEGASMKSAAIHIGREDDPPYHIVPGTSQKEQWQTFFFFGGPPTS
jgi:hypothetical protein